MRTRHLIFFVVAWLFQIQFAFSQTNKLYITPTDCPLGTTSNVAIQLDNSSEIVALQFNLHVPDVVKLANSGMRLLDARSDGHTITVKDKGENNYLVIVMSFSNKFFKGRSGALIELPLEVPDDLEAGKSFPFEMTDVILSDRNGKNVMTSFDAGSIRIVDGNGPDITVSSIQLISDNFTPGGKVSIAWTVQNVGGRATEAGWNEQLYLVDELGNEYFLGRLSCEEILSASGTISRQAEFNLSDYPGVEGTVKAKVVLTPFADLGELPVDAENNEVTSAASLNMPKILTWRINASSIQEENTQEIFCFLNRSGSRLDEETFTLTQSATGRLELPASVTIPKGESGVSFSMKTINDDVANRDSFVVVAVSGNSYPNLEQKIWIEDDETPALTVTAPETVQQEGNSFNLTIARPWTTEWPLEVRLSTDHPKRFTFASKVIIPKNAASVEVPVQVLEDDIPDVNVITAVFKASHTGYETGVGFVEVEDDDVPDIDLEITPTILPEGGGPQAAIATLRRSGVTDNKITIKLTDTSDGLLYYPSSSITLDSGETEYQFAIGISDNDQQEGDREVTLNASVYISTCDCSTAGTNVGTVTKKITITDNDGPTLTLSSSQTSLIEGKEQATVLTVTRNTSTTDALTVNISCDRPEEVTYTSTVTIPAGESSVDIPVAVKKNDTTEGNRTISFTATADGYSSGTCWAMITDQTLPDAAVTISVPNNDYKAGENVEVKVQVMNKGAAMLPSQTKVTVYLANSAQYSSATYKKVLGNLYTQNEIGSNGSEQITQSFILPNQTGDYFLIAVVNEEREIIELLTGNNISEAKSITLSSPYTVSVSTDKLSYKSGESILITGKITGNKNLSVPIDLYIINNGVRKVFSTSTNPQGDFQYTFIPESWQIGHISIGACFPNENLSEEMIGIDIYGLKRSSSGLITCEVITNQLYSGEIQLENPGNLDLTNVTAKVVSPPKGSTFNFESISKLSANSKGVLKFSINSTIASEIRSWEELEIQVSSSEGANLTFPLYYYCRSKYGCLAAELASINTTMTKGKERDIQLNIMNTGKGETGKITVNIPDLDWIKVLSAKEMPSLKCGEVASIILRLSPTDDQSLNVPLTGSFSISCENGKGLTMPFNITPVSESTGTLIIDVCDEYTYNTSEAPHVKGAKVRVTTPTNALVKEGTTDAAGIFRLDNIQEGYYIVEVTEDSHSDVYKNMVSIAPGIETTEIVNLSIQGIKVSWEVVETEVTDEYKIETTVDFDTNVPVPVVVMDAPDRIATEQLAPGESLLFNIVLTNKGLITAQDVQVNVPENLNTLEFEPLISDVFDLLPQSSVTIPVKVTKKSTMLRASSESEKDNCIVYASETYHWPCGNEIKNKTVSKAIQIGACIGGITLPSGGGGGSLSGWGGGLSLPNLGGFDTPNKFTVKETEQSGLSVPFICNILGGNSNDDDDLPEDPTKPFGDEYTGENEGNDEDEDDPSKLSLKLRAEKGYLNTEYFKNHAVRGIAADSASELRIEITKIPQTAVRFQIQLSSPYGENNDYLGSLEKTSGNISEIYNEENQQYAIKYHAPSEFPMEVKANHDIEVKMFVYDASGKEVADGDVSISIIRPPVLMTHGLADSRLCFSNLKKYLLSTGKYVDFQLRTSDYSYSNCDHFAKNMYVIKDNIDYLMTHAIYKGYVTSKVDLIGHSMGGLLSRMHVQSVDRNSVHKLITLNTPHSGSQGANLIIKDPIFRTLSSIKFKKNDAIEDLQVKSSAMNELNNKKALEAGIPIHAIITTCDFDPDIIYQVENFTSFVKLVFGKTKLGKGIELVEFVEFVAALAIHDIDASPLINEGKYAEGLNIFLKKLYQGKKDSPYDGISDVVVSYDSQSGGLSNQNVTYINGNFDNYWHCASPQNDEVFAKLLNLLVSSTTSEAFSSKGFNPVHITYDYSPWIPSLTRSGNPLILENSSSLSIEVENLGDRKIKIHKKPSSDIVQSAVVIFDDSENPTISFEDQFTYEVSTHFSGLLHIEAYGKNINGEIEKAETQITIGNRIVSPMSISFIDSSLGLLKGQALSPLVLCTWSDGSQSIVECELKSDSEIITIKDGMINALERGDAILKAAFEGLSCQVRVKVLDMDAPVEDEDINEASKGVCSSISLQFSQTMTMTRQAFRGTLTVFNGHETLPMEDVRLNLEVKDVDGNIATSREFQINTEKLDTFTGDLDGGWNLDAQKTGTVTILFIPSKYAAPTEEKLYSFGGTLSYVDPFTGLEVVRDLFPVTLAVSPSPNLKLTYFMQRDILGDDPLTVNKVEPSVPAEFALLIQNTGAGDATNVNMVTNQPEIVDNEKGLAIDFELLSSTLNGEEESLALGGSVTTAFGTIPAGQTSYAQWWFSSSLLGHFTDYEVKATHITSYDNPDLSLLDGDPTIHELIRGIKVVGSDLVGFLVNDLVDAEDMPDMIYLTDGSIEQVKSASGVIKSSGERQYTLTVTPSVQGWIYGSIDDPTGGYQELVGVTRLSDGATIDLRNIWQTSCTLRDGKDPLYENKIHFADKISGPTSYQLTFEPGPSVVLEVASFEGMPSDNEVADKPVTEVTVHFNKAIDPTTFTSEDLNLILQGERQDEALIKIERQDDQTFLLGLTEVTKLDGYYVLTVQTAGITDQEGFKGKVGKSVNWTQYLAPGYQTLSMDLSEGWNWISTNMEGVSDPMTLLFSIQTQVLRMQNQTQEVTNDPKLGLVGNLTDVVPETFYKLEMASDGKMDITGTVLTPNQVEIDLRSGWNWIGYIPRSAALPAKALALLSASVGDEVKGQDGFAQYNGSTWIGTLDKMEPGKGYMYRAGKSQTFQYPLISPLEVNSSLRSAELRVAANSPWAVDIHKYPNNMSMIADLWENGQKAQADEFTVGAFCGDECRGVGQYVEGRLFMTIYGGKVGEKISFRAIRNGQSSEWGILETVSFGESTQGSLDQPFVLTLGNQLTGLEILDRQNGIYPNPVKRILYIKGQIDDIRRVRVIGLNGSVRMSQSLNGENSLDVSSLGAGLYILVIERDQKVEFHKFIKE